MADEPDVYLIAFACEPGRGSEPGVGFAFARAGARLAEQRDRRVVLVTRSHRIEAIRAALGDDARFLEILAVGLPRPVVVATGRRFVRPAYVLWQLLASLRVRADVRRRGRPSLVHHVTFATEALPTFERLIGADALVFGPSGSADLGGGGALLRVKRALRRVAASSNLASADLLIAQNEDVRRSWRQHPATTVVESNIVVEPASGELPPKQWDAVCAGSLIPRKRADLAIAAFAASSATGRLAMLGEGPELDHLRAAAARHGIEDRVEFLGHVSREQVLHHLARSALLLHTSRQEGAGWVVGEAQSVGCVPIVFAGSGADSPVVAAGVGIVVDPAQRDGYREAIDAGLRGGRAAPSARWSAARLPDLLDEWYALALRKARSGVD